MIITDSKRHCTKHSLPCTLWTCGIVVSIGSGECFCYEKEYLFTGEIRGQSGGTIAHPFHTITLEIHEDVHILSQKFHILSHITLCVYIHPHKVSKVSFKPDLKVRLNCK